MALDMQSLVREVVSNVLQGASPGAGEEKNASSKGSGGGLSGMKGLAAGAGAAALAPLVMKGAGKLTEALGVDSLQDLVKSPGDALDGAVSNLGDRLTSTAKDKAKGAMDEAGGPGGMVKEAAKGILPGGGGGGGGGKGGAPGVGKGRRMPIQQSVDIGLPIETVYNQWTQFEDWPNFMHRVTRASQEDDCTVSFAVKIWGKTKEFTAKIETQRPDERIKWQVTQGMTHTGVVSFHELGPNLTRVLLGFNVDPGSLVEKFARGARHVKRAARADLHRFKAFIEMAEHETGSWRGVIEGGEVVEDHDPDYDAQREYSDIEDLIEAENNDEEQESEDQDEDEDQDQEQEQETHGRADEQDQEDGDDEESSPRRQRRTSQTRPRTSERRKRQPKEDDEKAHSGRRRRQSSSSDESPSPSRSSRTQASRGGSNGSSSGARSRSTGSRAGGRSRSSDGQSKSEAGTRSRSRSQNRQR